MGDLGELVDHHLQHGRLAVELHGLGLAADGFGLRFALEADGFRRLLRFVQLGVGLGLALDLFGFRLEHPGVLLGSRLFTDLHVQLLALDLDLLPFQLRLLFKTGQLGGGALLLEGLPDALLLDPVRLVGGSPLLFGLDLVGGLLQQQGFRLIGDGRVGLRLGLVSFLIRHGAGDLGVPLLLHRLLGGHGIDDRAVLILEVLDGQVDDLKAHVTHVGHGGLDGFLGELVPILNQLSDGHLTDDLTHVAFENVLGQEDDLLPLIVEQLLRSGGDGQIVGADLDVGDRVHKHGDILLRGHRLGGLDVHLHQTHIQLIETLDGRDVEGGAAADDAIAELLGGHRSLRRADLVIPAQQAGHDEGRVRGHDDVAGYDLDQDDQGDDPQGDHVPIGREKRENGVQIHGESLLTWYRMSILKTASKVNSDYRRTYAAFSLTKKRNLKR